MGFLDFLQSGDPKLDALVDTNHKLTTSFTSMLQNYTDQIVDLKLRVERLETIINQNTEQHDKSEKKL